MRNRSEGNLPQTPKPAPVGKKKLNLLANNELENKKLRHGVYYRISVFVGFSELDMISWSKFLGEDEWTLTKRSPS